LESELRNKKYKRATSAQVTLPDELDL